MSLRKETLSGVKWTSLSSVIVAVVQLLQLIILAHYLDASDFGLMAIVSVIIGFSALFMDMGISASIIHKQDISHEQLSSLYWLNVASGIFLFSCIYILSPYIASFYHEKELVPLMKILAVTFVVTGIGNQYGILLQKLLRFDVMAKISIATNVFAFLVAVILAMENFGVYALVYATLGRSVATTVLNTLIGIKEHRPSLIYRHKSITPMISFGMFQMGERSLNYVNSQFDVILIGKLLGVEVLGVYTIAKNLSMRPAQIINPVITKVTFPVMAKVQDDIPRLKSIYLKTINYLSSINFPVYLLIAILAEPVILLLFGEKWRDAIILLEILSVYGALRSTGNPIGSLQLARGRADLGFYWTFAMFLAMPLVIYTGSFWGVSGVAYSLVAAGIFFSFPGWYYMVKPLCGAGFKEYFWQILKPLLVSALAGSFSYGISLLFNIENMYVHVSLVAVTMGMAVLALNVLFNRDFIETGLEMIGRKKVG
ncbi:MOP flippase family protein [Sulfurovum sp. NBC37-1]|uniref:MOP flippase family protein n=1 Tax=Sulfurovum sp. (strain NBC37-1) TaxID=387093 RepID=UPI0001587B6D|nr:MOP flippase family protein [Sulfurovum sp. NBC37-1]BAF72498.1 polysaccharide transporter [Sulfurovum sp. NBC37-1]